MLDISNVVEFFDSDCIIIKVLSIFIDVEMQNVVDRCVYAILAVAILVIV